MRGQVEEVVVAIVVVVVVVVEHGSAASTIILDASNTNRQKRTVEENLRNCPFITSQVVNAYQNTTVFIETRKNFSSLYEILHLII